MLTGKEIAERGIIQGFKEEYIQQQGIDVRVESISRFGHYAEMDGSMKWVKNERDSDIGHVPEFHKTILPKSHNWVPEVLDTNRLGWRLEPGYYEVQFKEGCKMPNDCCMEFKTRSSVVRCGGEIRSGLFDAGFETEHMGAFLKVEEPMIIEQGARLAQVIVHNSNKVENTYNGQFQNDKQRKN